jgi:hypothetical protein
MFNVVMFTVLGSLYNVDVSPYTPRETNTNLNLAVLDSDYDEDDIPIRGYFNIYMRQNQIDQFLEYTTSASYWNYLGSATAATDTLAGAWLLASYGSTAPLSANYTSTENENTIIGTSAFTIDMSSIGSFSSLSAAMNYIASEITTKLQTIIDQRGLIATNPSKGLQALPTVQCYYDTTNLRLATSASSDDPCYLYGLTGSFMNDLGLSGKTATMDLKTSTDYISQNIITVREAIQDRSQITTQSIYLSPIIHTFNLSGTVYVNPLYDIATIKTEVEDALYSFYDLNADFNSAIHISELVDIIKNNNGVKFCDVGFQTVYPSRSDGQSYVAVELAKPIYTGYWSTLPGYSLIVLYLQLIANSVAGYQNQLDFTERYLMDLLKQLTDLFYSLFPLYFDSNDYLNLCSAIRKDNLRYIRDHLKNPYGNLGEGIIQSDGSTLYDFSVGSEIIKIRNTLTYSYKG